MIQLYYYGFLVICLALIVWGFIRLERIYQYPFFMGGIFLIFIYPQATSLVNYPGLSSETSIERVLLMSCLCLAMCWVGYQAKPNESLLQKLAIPVDDNKLLNAAIVLTAIGGFSNFLVNQSLGTVAAGAQWSGAITIYAFFTQTIYQGFTIFLMRLFKKPSVINICGTLIAAIPIWQTILGGRRQQTIAVLIIIGFSIWKYRGLLPPRWLIAIAIFLGFYLLPLIGLLRGRFWELVFEQNWEALSYTGQSIFNNLQEGKIVLELRNAAMLMDSAEFYGQYQWGAGYWDALIFQYLPGQLLGYDFKNSLMFNLTSVSSLYELYGYKAQLGTTPTGIGDAYLQFGYFGCLVFALIGYFFKTLWISSVEEKSMIGTLLMIGCITPAMISVSHGTGRFFQELVFQIGIIILVGYYVRDKTTQIQPKT